MKVSQALFFIREREKIEERIKQFLGGNGEEEIPEPIPNSEVKLLIANGTVHKSTGE